jgi:hypothetical protein
MSPECQDLLRTLADTTARLDRLEREDGIEIGPALRERGCAIDAIRGWAAREGEAGRPASAEVQAALASHRDQGVQILIRRVRARETARVNLMRVSRELQLLRGLKHCQAGDAVALNCRG